MVKKLSLVIANFLGAQLLSDADQIEIYAYALEIILGAVIKLGLLLLISSITNSLYTTLLCTLAFVGIRFFGGGVHLATYRRCLIGSLLILVILGVVANYKLDRELFLYIFMVVNILGVFTIIKWVPAGTEKKMVTDKTLILTQKLKTVVFLIICSSIIIIFNYYGFYTLANAIAYGILAAVILITPFGYYVVKKIDGILDKVG